MAPHVSTFILELQDVSSNSTRPLFSWRAPAIPTTSRLPTSRSLDIHRLKLFRRRFPRNPSATTELSLVGPRFRPRTSAKALVPDPVITQPYSSVSRLGLEYAPSTRQCWSRATHARSWNDKNLQTLALLHQMRQIGSVDRYV
jgi:hypothetical protein